MRRAVPLLLLPVALAAGGLVACGGDGGDSAASTTPTATPTTPTAPAAPTAAPAPAGTPAATTPAPGRISGVFVPYAEGASAVNYDLEIVPANAAAEVAITETGAGTTVTLAVTGLLPDRAYGAHVHTNPCGPSPDDAGPHYQHEPDPEAVASPPSVDPGYANPHNEVWLDFRTDAAGAATVTARQEWRFDAINPPGSLVIHAETTRTAPGVAGAAGARVACLTLAR